MYQTVKGLVLRVTAYNDTDSILSLLTEEYGKITVKARGLRRKNSPLIAACQLLAYGEFTLFAYRGFYTINEANTVELFHGLRRDLQKLSLGTYFAQVAELVCQEGIPDTQFQSLILNCLYGLSKLDIPQVYAKAVFELRTACIAGYTPDLSGCFYCGYTQPNRFDISQGHLSCSSCRIEGQGGIHMPVLPGTLDAMRYICSCDVKKIFAFALGDCSLEQLSQISESYLLSQLERGFSALDFYKTLLFEN